MPTRSLPGCESNLRNDDDDGHVQASYIFDDCDEQLMDESVQLETLVVYQPAFASNASHTCQTLSTLPVELLACPESTAMLPLTNVKQSEES